MPSIDFYQTVTDRIVAALEAGSPPWVRPWSTLGDQRPHNALTHRAYRGINTWLLTGEADLHGYALPRWLTFRQTVELGGRIRRGEHGVTVVYYKLSERRAESADPDSTPRVIPFLRTYTLFNVAQTEGLPDALLSPVTAAPDWLPSEVADGLLTDSGAQIRVGGQQAFYQPSLDYIQLPERIAFRDPEAYYAVALHELTHWSAHPNRCDRSLTGRFGDAAYAMEELIAEMGSAYLCAHCRIDGRLQHLAYLAHWLRVLKADKRAIFTAAAKAQQAADYLIGRTVPPDQVEEAETVAA